MTCSLKAEMMTVSMTLSLVRRIWIRFDFFYKICCITTYVALQSRCMSDTQFKKGILPLCVLSLLAKKGECYGYEITSLISKELDVKAATIYLILNRFTELGYLKMFVVSQEKRPQRKYYRLTAQGIRYQKHLLSEWTVFEQSVRRLINE